MYVYIFLKSCIGVAQQFPTFLIIFLLLPVSTLNSILGNYVVSKTVVEKFTFSELKTEKVIFFTQSSTKVVCSSVFNVGGCLASCLIFRSLLRSDTLQLGYL